MKGVLMAAAILSSFLSVAVTPVFAASIDELYGSAIDSRDRLTESMRTVISLYNGSVTSGNTKLTVVWNDVILVDSESLENTYAYCPPNQLPVAPIYQTSPGVDVRTSIPYFGAMNQTALANKEVNGWGAILYNENILASPAAVGVLCMSQVTP